MTRRLDGLLVGTGDELFVGPLMDLIAIGLHKPAFERFLRGVAPSCEPAVDRQYLVKILREECGRQFGEPLRPVVELVLNAVDAHEGARADVDISLSEGAVVVADRGSGMSLERTVSRLLIPFSTEKNVPGPSAPSGRADRLHSRDIGRFGVGFFSVLGLACHNPEAFGMRVDTSTADADSEAWAVGFCSPTPDPADVVCSIRRAAPRQRGTRVSVFSPLLEPTSVTAYLSDSLHFFPSARGMLRLDGHPLNPASGQLADRRLAVAVGTAGTVHARARVGGLRALGARAAGTYAMGVRVESSESVDHELLLDFPPEVELTQGRDALRPGPVHAAVCAAFHSAVAAHGKSVFCSPPRNGDGPAFRAGAGPSVAESAVAAAQRAGRDGLASSAAQTSAILLHSSGWPGAGATLAKELLGRERYLVSSERVASLVAFLGPWVAPWIFVPTGFWAEREWSQVLPGERELLARFLELGTPRTLQQVVQTRVDLVGLNDLLQALPDAAGTYVTLGRASQPPGPVPVWNSPFGILVREDAPSVRGRPHPDARRSSKTPVRGLKWFDRHALRAAFERARSRPEADVERTLILGAHWDA